MSPSHPFLQRTLQHILDENLIRGGDRVLVGVSGGPDSMALLECLAGLKDFLKMEGITVLHFEHGLRGEESLREMELVRAAAAGKSLPFMSAGDDVRAFAAEAGVSLEMAARHCRHRFFLRAMSSLGGDKLALGHHANDQAEEVLLRLCRGTGPSGMTGMLPQTREGIIRPFLFAGRKDILEFLNDLHLPYAVDSSNEQLCCQRNVLRRKVLPVLEEHMHRAVVDTLCRHAALAREEEAFWGETLHAWSEEFCLRQGPASVSVRLEDLLARHIAFRRRLYRHLVSSLCGHCTGVFLVHVNALDRLAGESTSGRAVMLPGGVAVSREGDRLVFSLGKPEGIMARGAGEAFELVMEGPGSFQVANRGLCIHVRLQGADPELTDPEMRRPDLAFMDADQVVWPLSLRFWREGDRFMPMGLQGMKKVQDFFVDAKVPRRRRFQIPILCDREKICWIVGHRLDDRVKITPRSKTALVVEVLFDHPADMSSLQGGRDFQRDGQKTGENLFNGD